jgi:cell division protein FtsN
LDGDRQELRSIKNELDDLKRASLVQVQMEQQQQQQQQEQQQQQQQQQHGRQAPTPSRSVWVGGGGGDAFAATKRLAKERQDLISTGAYNATHPIIQAIDTKLQQLGQPIRDGSA